MSYKEAKEAFVSDTTGSSIFHVLKISSITVCSLATYFALTTRHPGTLFGRRHLSTRLLIEVALLVIPTLLGLTIAAETPLYISVALCLICLFLTWRPKATTAHPSPQYLSKSPSLPPLQSLTIYRAQMLLLTSICILAVDFPVFPRALAKCESWGVSVMDLGVGSFVFSQGVVSAIPIVRDPNQLSDPIFPKMLATARKVLPLLALGLVRVLLVKGTEYPEHVSEYGVHWNFFITLALLPVVSVLIHPLIANLPPAAIGLGLTAAHQALLSGTSLQSWAISDERFGIIGQNKEGITSLPGYLAIHVIGFAIGLVILPVSPSHFRRALRRIHISGAPPPGSQSPTSTFKSKESPNVRQLDKTATELGGYVIVWWTIFAVTRLVGGGTSSVSRRLANMPYVFLTAAYNSLFILAYMALEIGFSPASTSEKSHGKHDSMDSVYFSGSTYGTEPRDVGQSLDEWKSTASVVEKDAGLPRSIVLDEAEYGARPLPTPPREPPLQAPMLLEAINLNGLALFLIANVLTGLVNLSMQTMYASDSVAMLTLMGYLSAICGLAWWLRGTRLVRL
ncbi:Glucosaminyl phosphatidylinositol (GlcN-PI) nositol acylation protein [Tulasnella sp. JGI-2019a]|nr:Glucosaminyl phosphatidylinositol (GlcN-PI) nositol acylation protein [Tulasnella sp. JGI-2019a]KAG9009950.1 Glucosaminyl phosphatidylinositol (GlcN-PI) nositol acylation protein [Tulasnella sp. JGI-2019a]